MRFLISLSCCVCCVCCLVALCFVVFCRRRLPPFPAVLSPRPAVSVIVRAVLPSAAPCGNRTASIQVRGMASRFLQIAPAFPTVHAIMPLRSRAHAHSATIHAHVTGDSTVTRCPSFRGEQDADADCGTRFLLAYGDQDRTIPVEDQDTARRVISETRGARLCTYPGMAHAICDREIDDIRDFLR